MASVDKTQSDTRQESVTIHGSCFCGVASYKLEGNPFFSVYCHCTRCQRGHASPFVLVLHYPSEAFTWTHANQDAVFTNSEASSQWKEWRCKSCLCIIGHEKSGERWSIKGALFRRNAQGLIENWHLIKPTDHIFYDTRMLDINDGLPKWEGFTDGSRRMDSDVRD